MHAMPTSFQEFLRQKVEGSDWRDRARHRSEWLGGLRRLIQQIEAWLRESDPEGLLEQVTYDVQCVEPQLGVYDAPAMKIRLNTDYAEVRPIGRFTTHPIALQNLLFIPGNRERWGNLSGGRVDITNGERRHLLLRSADDGQERWCALMAGQATIPVPFDSGCLERILEDLLK
jgi:hypothetical protein